VTDDDRIPTCGAYRGVPIHAEQPRERIETVVHPAIDDVFAHAQDVKWLWAYCTAPGNPPEARWLAAATIKAEFDLAVKERRSRPDGLSVREFEAAEGLFKLLTSNHARHDSRYCLSFDRGTAPGEPRAAEREQPLQRVAGWQT
jgi:hypothetical protein